MDRIATGVHQKERVMDNRKKQWRPRFVCLEEVDQNKLVSKSVKKKCLRTTGLIQEFMDKIRNAQ